jgi:nucleotide-binding universal stress UspA family protein
MADAKPAGATSDAACPPTRPLFKRVLVIVTGIRGYEEVVREASELAKAFGAEVVALYVLDQNKVRQLSRFSSQSIEAVEADLEEDGWTYLYYTEQLLLDQSIPVFLRFEEGAFVERVIDVEKEIGADLVVTQQPSQDEDRTFRGYLPALIDRLSCTVMVVNT